MKKTAESVRIVLVRLLEIIDDLAACLVLSLIPDETNDVED